MKVTTLIGLNGLECRRMEYERVFYTFALDMLFITIDKSQYLTSIPCAYYIIKCFINMYFIHISYLYVFTYPGNISQEHDYIYVVICTYFIKLSHSIGLVSLSSYLLIHLQCA